MNLLLCDTGAYNEDLIELEAQRKNEEAREEEINGAALKRLKMQERAKEILFEEAIVNF